MTQFVLAKLLAINAKDAINYKDAKGRTPLHYATRRGHDMVIKVGLSVVTNKLYHYVFSLKQNVIYGDARSVGFLARK